MAEPCFFYSLSLSGFRAYLQPKTFDFSKKKCLAIFAPNGKGKSSVIDAMEFMFSKDGTLERLGRRTINNQAGPAALAHNLAEENGIDAKILIEVISGRTISTGCRFASGARRPMPDAAANLRACFAVEPIIRGHALRSFVEVHTAESRYTDVANWLHLGPLVEVQKNLRGLRAQVKSAAEDSSALHRIDTQLARETAQNVQAWDIPAILSYINTAFLRPLDPALGFASLATDDPVYEELKIRAKAEENKIGLAGLRQIHNAATALWVETKNPENDDQVVSGAIHDFSVAVTRLIAAEKREKEERSKAANCAFQTLWNAAQPFFAEGVTAPQVCPVCATPLEKTAAGSSEEIRKHIGLHLEELRGYAAAKKTLDEAKAAACAAHADLIRSLKMLIDLLGDNDKAVKPYLLAFLSASQHWPGCELPSPENVTKCIAALLTTLNLEIDEIESSQGEHTYSKAKAKIDRLLDLAIDLDRVLRKKGELAKISEELTRLSAVAGSDIRKKVQALLDTLQRPMNEIYRRIQGASAQNIRLELPAEDDTNQQRLNLLIDFAENRPGVQPSGYLSDSQIHSVALALRLAAIKQFNTKAPIVALDDIVTSYDADHRRTIAALIFEEFKTFQVIITTHDERFFRYLKDQLGEANWHFTQITSLEPHLGPRFADHKVSDDMIEELWANGKSAANEMRQAEEEWLLGICREVGVSVRIRSLDRAYSYERSELASALGSFLKKEKLTPISVPGVNNKFLDSLIKGEIENFGSHFQDAQYGNGSIGDERARWEEFKYFRSQFVCPRCGKQKFKRPLGMAKPVCANETCETQFAFAGPPVAVFTSEKE